MKRSLCRLVVAVAVLLSIEAPAQAPAAEEARRFVDAAEQRLLEL